MKFDKFTIKYLPEIFPHVNFEQEFSENFSIIKTEDKAEIISTEDRWFSIFDSDSILRNIQVFLNTKYTCQFKASENVDFGILKSAENITAITDLGEVITLFDVEINKEKIPNSRDFKVTMTFTRKSINNIASFLDSSNVKKLETDVLVGNTPIIANKLTYSIKRPAYTARITTDINGRFSVNLFYSPQFDNIQINDYLYMHSENMSVNDIALDTAIVKCYKKSVTEIFFEPVIVKQRNTIDNARIQLDFSPEQKSSILVQPRILEVEIYTALKHKTLSQESVFSDEILKPSQIKKYVFAKTGYILNTLFYLKTTELWKLRYLNYSDFAKYTDANGIEFFADYQADIFLEKERSSLSNLHEIELKLPFSTMTAEIS